MTESTQQPEQQPEQPQQPQQQPAEAPPGWQPPPPPQGQQGQQGQQQGWPAPPQGQQGWQAPPQGQGYGYPPAPQGMQPGAPTSFDQATGLNIPAGTQLASRGRRIGAFFLAYVLSIVTLGIGYLIWGLVVWSKGTSPALQVLGMKCYHVEGQRVAGWGRMALRDVIGSIVDEIAIFGLISFILFLTNNRRQSLHDMIANTVVLYDPNKVLG
jgi:uncharacterized RDD family membrane protein YckC